MRQLFELIYRYRAFFLFVLLEVLSFWMLFGSSYFHNAAIFNTSNSLIASIYVTRQRFYKYFNLDKVNRDLAKENAYLRELIGKKRVVKTPADSVSSFFEEDTTRQYEYFPARVINNSFRFNNNYITINKGYNDGVRPDMGVISSWGVVGQVKSVSGRFATIYSFLHSEIYVSAVIKRLGVYCSAKWMGGDPYSANLLYVPRHVQIRKGDSIVTSGYNAVFPPGIPVGFIETYSIEKNETFYNIRIRLSNDFTSLAHVYLIKNDFRTEKDSLETINEQ